MSSDIFETYLAQIEGVMFKCMVCYEPAVHSDVYFAVLNMDGTHVEYKTEDYVLNKIWSNPEFRAICNNVQMQSKA